MHGIRDFSRDWRGRPLSMTQRADMARYGWTQFAALLRDGHVGSLGDLYGVQDLYGYVNRPTPPDVEQAMIHPASSLRGLAFDALALRLFYLYFYSNKTNEF